MRTSAVIVLSLAAAAGLSGCYEDMDGGAGAAPAPSGAGGSESATDQLISGPRQPALGKAKESAKSTIGALEDRSEQIADQIDDGGFDDA